jgi:1-acyl-sn-glycerol-3-phosphate acyltransferase
MNEDRRTLRGSADDIHTRDRQPHEPPAHAHVHAKQAPALKRGGFVQRAGTALVWFGIGILVLFWLPLLTLIFIATAPFDPGRYTVGRWFRNAAVAAVAINPFWRFRTSGARIDDPRRPYIAVANHESFADIFLICHLPWEMKWLSKDAVFRLPFMGWMMRMAGDISVKRGNLRSRKEALEGIRDRLRKRVSVMVMPEGTRSTTGELLPFRDGAFRLAIEEQVPILPIALVGTRNAMAKGSLLFNRAVAEARVLEPVPTEGMTLADVPALRDGVRARIIEARDALLREIAMHDYR